MLIGYLLIILFASLSYLIGFYEIYKNKYKPNLFTRSVWLALAFNNLFSVIKLHNQDVTLALAWVTLLGSLLIFGASLFKGDKQWSKNETIPAILLLVSLFIWIFSDIPILNLCIGLLAHLLGSIPTVIRVIKNPKSESVPFWALFAVASILGIFLVQNGSFKDYLFLGYFCVFDGSMTLLSLRKYWTK